MHQVEVLRLRYRARSQEFAASVGWYFCNREKTSNIVYQCLMYLSKRISPMNFQKVSSLRTCSKKNLSIKNHVSPKPHIWSSHSLRSFPQSWTMKTSLPGMCHQIDQTTTGLWVSQRISCPKNCFVWKTTPVLVFQFPVSYTLYIYIFFRSLFLISLIFFGCISSCSNKIVVLFNKPFK